MAMGIALALALLLLVAKEASAGKYAVAQCGWYVGADASWADTTGGAKFRQDGWCVPPAGQDPFDGAHLKSFTRDGQATVSGTRFARWRWEAPAGTGITQVRGTWWHVLHDGMEQRLGVGTWNGGFDPFASAAGTDTTPREFVAGFNPPQPALEDRLLCAKAESKSCGLDPGSWSAVRALTITVEDDQPPAAAIGGGVVAGGWRRGAQMVGFSGSDVGGGVRFGETTVDGARVNLTEYSCAKAAIGGEWRATQMRPCGLAASGSATVDTARFSDGPHSIHHCVTDFAGNAACTPERTFYVDNNPPAHPRNLALAGGEDWRRANDFDLFWANPDQGVASAIGGAIWRVEGPAGYDSGVKFTPGHELSALPDLFVPHAGIYTLSVWLRDEAGNEAQPSAVSLPLRFDDVLPGVAFDAPAVAGEGPAQIQAQISDAHSGPASGEIRYRRLGSEQWTELPAKFQAGQTADSAQLLARLPGDLAPGTYLFRADAADAAGNTASTTRRADGVEMTMRVTAGAGASSGSRAEPDGRGKARIFARLGWRGHVGTELTVPFGTGAMLKGRLVNADGAGLAGRTLRIVSRPSRGALARARVDTVETGAHGGFGLRLAAGTSRRVAVAFSGEAHLDGASRRPLTLRVRGGIDFKVAPEALHTDEAARFSGRVRTLGAPLPRRGKLVAIQYYEEAAKRWRPVLVTRTDHSGRFQASYRFRYISGSASIRLRAAALSEERWPYAPGASRPVTVRVTG
ncbi:MAG TPA: Ig-like domain repeat protein [Solirubrobacterales bacterium]|nr:Ig-like domain repeat protein [Solirubrobacterales bacterium]